MTNHHPSVRALAEAIEPFFDGFAAAPPNPKLPFKDGEEYEYEIEVLCDLIESHLHPTLLIDALKKSNRSFMIGATLDEKVSAINAVTQVMSHFETGERSA